MAVAYATQVEWSALVRLTDLGDIEDAAESLLEAETFTTATAYDALNRPVSATTPDASEVRPTYNEAGLLEKVDVRIRGAVDWTSFVDDIDYGAKGQREKIVYGNGTETTYTYDPLTFRLSRLKTVRHNEDSTVSVLQNLSYTYDPVGNIVAIADSAQQTVFFNNDVVSPSTRYVYDAIYRLVQASGREHAGGVGDVQRDQNDLPLMNLPHENDSAALRNYTELYGYDEVGNILSMIHQAGMAENGRRYEGRFEGNRLLSTSLPGDETAPYSATYSYDAHGNMTAMPHLSSVGWDYRDQMMSSDLGGGGVVYYTYDAGGQRVRKVWEHSGRVEERIYLGGYEVYRKRDVSGLLLERQTLHVMDGEKRVALVETKTVDEDAGGSFEPSTVIRYQLGNHLGSAVLEVDGDGAVISYEEYHPYGTSAYRSGTGAAEVSRKRYRYTGKEKDEETGLYYHGARSYACWLGRWTAADPAGLVDGLCLYAYSQGCPICRHDSNGLQSSGMDTKFKLSPSLSSLAESAGYHPKPVTIPIPELSLTPIKKPVVPRETSDEPAKKDEKEKKSTINLIEGAGNVSISVGTTMTAEAGLRAVYDQSAHKITEQALKMAAEGGNTSEAVEGAARWANQARNELKVVLRDKGSVFAKALAEARNVTRSGNKIGPTFDQLILEGKTPTDIIGSAGKANIKISRAAARMKLGGKFLIAIDIAIVTWEVISAPEGSRLRTAAGGAGGIAGAIVGGKLGTAGGVKVGGAVGTLIEPGGGTAIGGAVGGLLGGSGGAILGGFYGKKGAESLFDIAEDITAPNISADMAKIDAEQDMILRRRAR
ncbi:MAG: RHS repeat-associated core domain-containing protein [Byssovorax sp.]